MCNLDAPSSSPTSEVEKTRTITPSISISTMRMTAQVEADDLKPFVQNSSYSKASYVRFFFKHAPDITIGKIEIDKLVRNERIPIYEKIQVPSRLELVIAYDFRDAKDQQVVKWYWVCATAEFPKGSVAKQQKDNRSNVSIISAIRLKAIVGIDEPDAPPVRFGIIGTKYGPSLPLYEFVNPSLARPKTLLNDSELMRQAKIQRLSEVINDDNHEDWIRLEHKEFTDSDKDDDNDWLLVDSTATASDDTEMSFTPLAKSKTLSAMDINFDVDVVSASVPVASNSHTGSAMDINPKGNPATSREGINMYACLNSIGLEVNGADIMKKYIELAHTKYGRFPTNAEIRYLMALMQHYGLATSLTVNKLAQEIISWLAKM